MGAEVYPYYDGDDDEIVLTRWADIGKTALQREGSSCIGKIGWQQKPEDWAKATDSEKQDYYLWCVQYYAAQVMERNIETGKEIYRAATSAREALNGPRPNYQVAWRQVQGISKVANTNRALFGKFAAQFAVCLFSGVIPYLLVSLASALNNKRKHGVCAVPWWSTRTGFAHKKAQHALSVRKEAERQP